MKNYKILIIGEVSNLELVTCQFANIIDKLLCLRLVKSHFFKRNTLIMFSLTRRQWTSIMYNGTSIFRTHIMQQLREEYYSSSKTRYASVRSNVLNSTRSFSFLFSCSVFHVFTIFCDSSTSTPTYFLAVPPEEEAFPFAGELLVFPPDLLPRFKIKN